MTREKWGEKEKKSPSLFGTVLPPNELRDLVSIIESVREHKSSFGHIMGGGIDFMEAIQQSTAIHALALSLSRGLSRDETARLGLLLIQLGTTLDTISALQELDSGVAAEFLKNC